MALTISPEIKFRTEKDVRHPLLHLALREVRSLTTGTILTESN
jgi:hypothetical protein